MPTYEYQCKSCNHRFEIWQKMTDEPLTDCPECNGTIRRIFFPAGIVFKGSGFYKTDHGSGAVGVENSQNRHNGHKDDKESAPKTESASETKASGEKASSPAPAGDSKVATAAD